MKYFPVKINLPLIATMLGFGCPQGWAFLQIMYNQGKKGQIPGDSQSQAWGLMLCLFYFFLTIGLFVLY
jgi:hypothetical protein